MRYINLSFFLLIILLSGNVHGITLTCDFTYQGDGKNEGAILNSAPFGCADGIIKFLKENDLQRYNLLNPDLKHAKPPLCPHKYKDMGIEQFSIFGTEFLGEFSTRYTTYQVRRVCIYKEQEAFNVML